MSTKISLKQLIFEYLNSKDEGSDRYRRLFRIATLQGVRKFNMDVCGTFQTVLLPINANMTVSWPMDYLDWSMLGIVNSEGEAVPLQYNENLVTIKQAYVNGMVQPVPQQKDGLFAFGPDGFPFLWINYCFDGCWMHLYGLGGGTYTPGQFQVNEEAQCFMISPGFKYSTIILEYLTNGYDCDDQNFKIPIFAADAFMAWLRWKDAIDQPKKFSMGQVREFKKEWSLEKSMCRVRQQKARITQMEEVYRHHIKLAARA